MMHGMKKCRTWIDGDLGSANLYITGAGDDIVFGGGTMPVFYLQDRAANDGLWAVAA